MLSTGDTAALLALLSEDRSMENHVSAFTLTFKRHQHFTACCCLLLLLEDWRILKQTQRLAALYILFDLYRVEQPSTNPFMSSLVDVSFVCVSLFAKLVKARNYTSFGFL
jgi:hypothetical protein